MTRDLTWYNRKLWDPGGRMDSPKIFRLSFIKMHVNLCNIVKELLTMQIQKTKREIISHSTDDTQVWANLTFFIKLCFMILSITGTLEFRIRILWRNTFLFWNNQQIFFKNVTEVIWESKPHNRINNNLIFLSKD